MIKWLDIVDQQQFHKLITTYNLQLTNPTRSFLESFARLVNNAATTRQKLVLAATQRKQHLHTVNTIIAEEVSILQSNFPNIHIIPYRHPETSLPIVYVRITAVPDLVIHIYRSYAQTRKGLAFGFRAYSFCRGHLTGPLARATNYLRARCQAHSWNFSLPQLVSLWCNQIATIPLNERQSQQNPKPRMIRRRRLENNPDSPPHASDTVDHASIPQNHPKTDVLIKDDKLFPNRTFSDPEELYAEQVRAIRKKRKAVPEVLDDYELAWKKRRPTQNKPSSEQLEPPQADPQPSPQSQPLLSQSSALHPRSLFPVRSSDDNPSEPGILPTPVTNKPESPEEPEVSFLNPLSPELKHSSSDETPSSPLAEARMDNQIQDQDAAKMEAAERAVLTKPVTSKNITTSHTPDADNANCISDDNSPPLFFFSTAGDDPTLSVAPPTHVPTEEEVTADGTVEATDTTTISEEKKEPVVVASLGTDRTDQVTVTPETKVTQRSQQEGSTLSTAQDVKSGQVDEGIPEPSFSFEQRFEDQGFSQVDIVDKPSPTTGGEDRAEEDSKLQADSNSPKDINEQDKLEHSLPSKTVKETLENADAKDKSSEQRTAGIVPPATTDHLTDSSLVVTNTPKESKKRSRESSCSDDIIVMDPESEEENEKSAKKRRLGDPINSGSTLFLSPSHEKIDSPVNDTKGERPSPRNIAVSTPERTVRSPEKDIDKNRETKPVHEVLPSVTKEVTRDVLVPDPIPFSGYGAVSIPAGVERDPCPMALSEPSESSDYSSHRGSNSDAGSISDGQPDER